MNISALQEDIEFLHRYLYIPTQFKYAKNQYSEHTSFYPSTRYNSN